MQNELYDEQTDPNEFTNLAKEAQHAATVQQLQRMLSAGRSPHAGTTEPTP